MIQNKTIMIISPQKWGNMKLSKHHYAIELSKHNIVYFLNPPNTGFFSINIKSHPNIDNLKIINYSDWKLRSFKNRINWVYNIGFNYLFKKILSSIESEIDIIINFDNGVYYRYVSKTGNKINIFFPVDKLIDNKINESIADIAFSISQNILNEVKLSEDKKYLLNHGLTEVFELNAKRLLKNGFKDKTNKHLNVAYVGNILIEILDRNIFLKLIEENSHIEFHFFGNISNSYRINSEDTLLSKNDDYFIKQLKSLRNVNLYGIVSQDKLISNLNTIDIFLLLYKPSSTYTMDNSHKVIEYLSFGKPIVSSYLSHYKDSSLLQMSDSMDTLSVEAIFYDIIHNYSKYYTKEKFQEKINFALNNTYRRHITTIGRIIK